jgi:hypothetical protein
MLRERALPYTGSVRLLGAAALVFTATFAAALVGQEPIDLAGTWSGTASDFWVNQKVTDGMRVTWELTQAGGNVGGTVTSTNLTASNDGSCSGCHRTKGGTVSGTVSGNTLALTMTFPGNVGEITPHCSATFSGSTTSLATDALTFAYTGTDSCEGPFNNGSLVMAPGPPSAPSVSSQPVSQSVNLGGTASLGVTTPGTPPLAYQWFRGASGVTSNPVAGGVGRTLTTEPVTAASLYWVRVSNFFGSVDSAAAELVVAAGFTDDLLIVGGTAVKAIHITELRDRIAAARARAGLTTYTYTDNSLTPQQTIIRAEHVAELRASLTEVYSATGREAPLFTHASLPGMAVRRIHLDELRAAVVAIE